MTVRQFPARFCLHLEPVLWRAAAIWVPHTVAVTGLAGPGLRRRLVEEREVNIMLLSAFMWLPTVGEPPRRTGRAGVLN